MTSDDPLLAEARAACNCAGERAFSSRRRRRANVGSWLGLVAGVAAVLAPKCPLCLAGYLSMLGLGVGLARFAPMLFPFGLVVASIALVSLVRSRRKSVSPAPRGEPLERMTNCTRSKERSG